MISEIQYGGLANVPSEHESAEGSLAASLNVINEYGALKPVQKPSVLFRLPIPDSFVSWRIIAMHKVVTDTNYILEKKEYPREVTPQGQPSGTPSYRLYCISQSAIDKLKGDNNKAPQLERSHLIDIGAVPGAVESFAIVGNVIAIAGNPAVFPAMYLFWQKGSYRMMPQQAPRLPIKFSLDDRKAHSAGFTAAMNRWKVSETDTEEMWSFDSDHNKTVCANGYFGQVNAIVAEQHRNSRFTQAFFVRYALRLVGGGYLSASEPVLLDAFDVGNVRCSTIGRKYAKKYEFWDIAFNFEVMSYALYHQVGDASGIENLIGQWGELIDAVEVFVSAPVYRLDSKGNVTVQGMERIAKLGDDHILKNAPMIKPGRNEDFLKNVRDTFNFYHYATIPLETLRAQGQQNKPLLSDEKDLNNVVARSLLDTSNTYPYTFAPEYLHAYNNRLIMGAVNRLPGELCRLETLFTPHIHPQKDAYIYPKAYYEVYSEYNNQWLVHHSDANIRCFGKWAENGYGLGFPSWLFVSDMNAKYIRLVIPLNYVADRPITHGDATPEAISSVGHSASGEDSEPYGPLLPDGFHQLPDGTLVRIPNPDSSNINTIDLATKDYEVILRLTPHDFMSGAYWFANTDNIKSSAIPAEDVALSKTLRNIRENLAVKVLKTDNTLYSSDVNNPFVFPKKYATTVGDGELMAITSAAKALSQGQFGKFPLYAFTTEGIWAMEFDGTGVITARQPITRDVCISRNSITQLDSSVLFATVRGVMLLEGSQVACVSEVVNNPNPFDIRTLPKLNRLTPQTCNIVDVLPHVMPLPKLLTDCGMMYDYEHQRVYVYSPHSAYAWIYSLQSHKWGMAESAIAYTINSYPSALAVVGKTSVVDFGRENGDARVKGLVVTRPLRLEMPNVLKTVDSLIQRGYFRQGNVQTMLYGSRNLFDWHIVWSSRDHWMSGFHGTPYKYFRIVSLCNLQRDESLYGASVSVQAKRINKLR